MLVSLLLLVHTSTVLSLANSFHYVVPVLVYGTVAIYSTEHVLLAEAILVSCYSSTAQWFFAFHFLHNVLLFYYAPLADTICWWLPAV